VNIRGMLALPTVRLALRRRPSAAVIARLVGDQLNVHDSVNSLIGDLRGELVLRSTSRRRGRSRGQGGSAQIVRQAVAERRHPGTETGVRLSQPNSLRRSSGSRRVRGRLGRSLATSWTTTSTALAGGSRRRRPASARPDVLEMEVAGELVDPPGREVCAVFGASSSTSSSWKETRHVLGSRGRQQAVGTSVRTLNLARRGIAGQAR